MSEFVPYRPGIKPTRQKLVILTETGFDVAPQTEAEPAEVQPEQAPVESFPILLAGEEWSGWLESNGLEVAHDSNWEWLPHPTKPGQWVVGVGVTPRDNDPC